MLSKAQTIGMKRWRGLHPAHYVAITGAAPHYGGRRGIEKRRHAQWRWGQKRKLRRARRRLDKILETL